MPKRPKKRDIEKAYTTSAFVPTPRPIGPLSTASSSQSPRQYCC
jgi:hypothetical protein